MIKSKYISQWLGVFVLILFVGCASIEIPNYIKDDNPYRKTFDSPYETVLEAAQEGLMAAGWIIANSKDPSVYEQARTVKEGKQIKQVLILTQARQVGLFLGTRYARINVYVQSTDDVTTDVEIRYMTANSVGFKTFYNYKHDKSVERLFQSIEKNLTQAN